MLGIRENQIASLLDSKWLTYNAVSVEQDHLDCRHIVMALTFLSVKRHKAWLSVRLLFIRICHEFQVVRCYRLLNHVEAGP